MSTTTEVLVPDLGSHQRVPVIELLVKPGDAVEKDQGLLTLESDKATMEIPASVKGVIKELKVKLGDEVSTGSIVALIEEAKVGEKAETKKNAPAAADVLPLKSAAAAGNGATPVAKPVASAVQGATRDLPYASPAVRFFARELGIDLYAVQGTGRKSRITREDVESHAKKGARAGGEGAVGLKLPAWPDTDFSKWGETEGLPLSRIKKISGANLARNWMMIPHVTQHEEADVTDMEAFRKSVAEQNKDLKITPLVFLIKAVVAALRQFPHFNASLSANGEDLLLKKYFHIGIAVDTPDGLVVPVIKDCDKKSLLDLAKELAAISIKAKEKKLAPADMSGGCFSISSLGGIGGVGFTPIINAPEVAILGVSKAQIKPTWDGQQFAPRLMLPLSLSYDHRVIDGAAAARFAQHLAQSLADIRRLLL